MDGANLVSFSMFPLNTPYTYNVQAPVFKNIFKGVLSPSKKKYSSLFSTVGFVCLLLSLSCLYVGFICDKGSLFQGTTLYLPVQGFPFAPQCNLMFL